MHVDCGQDLPFLRATPLATPKVLFTHPVQQGVRTLLPQNVPYDLLGHNEVMVPGHSWAAAAQVPWVLLTCRKASLMDRNFSFFFGSRGHHPLGRVKFRLKLIPYYLAANQSASRLLISTLKYW